MVAASARQPTAVLVVSAWHEGTPPRLIARITYTLDVIRPERMTVVAVGAEDIAAVVRRWSREVEAAGLAGDAPVTDT